MCFVRKIIEVRVYQGCVSKKFLRKITQVKRGNTPCSKREKTQIILNMFRTAQSHVKLTNILKTVAKKEQLFISLVCFDVLSEAEGRKLYACRNVLVIKD